MELNRIACFSVVVAMAIGPSLAAAGAPPAPTPPAPRPAAGRAAQSVKPAAGTVRIAVNVLLGWRVGIDANVFPDLTFAESATHADALGLGSVGGDSGQRVSPQIDQNLDFNLSADGVAFVKQRLNALALKMTTYRVAAIPDDPDSRNKLFAFAKDLGVETIVTDAVPASLAQLDALAGTSGVNLAIESNDDPTELVHTIQGLSPRIGISADLAQWMEHGIRPVDGLAAVKDRLMVAELSDRSGLGPNSREVRLGTGAGDLERFLYQVAEQEPQPEEKPNACVNCARPYGGTRPLFIALSVSPWKVIMGGRRQPNLNSSFATLWQEAEDFEKIVRPAMGYRVEQDARLIPITGTERIPNDVRAKIEAALPRTAVATPKQPRKLLVIDLCPGGAYYHDTIANANFAIQKMADTTHAFQPIFSNDLNNLKYPNILKYDAVFLNSIVGEVFSDPAVMDGLIRFVRQGGGVAGLHGSTYASEDIPEYGEMIGATTGPHRVEPATLKVDDPDSPLTRQFASSPLTAAFGGRDFTWTDEFYHFLPDGPYSREKVHVLISIDAEKSDLSNWQIRPDKDYASAWIKSYGKGRVFDCVLGHTPMLFETPAMAQMVLNGIQFALGDLPADTTPSALLKK